VSFMNWLSMNLLVDIACVVFFAAAVWKFKKLEKELLEIHNDIEMVAKNPSLAKRLIKERKIKK